MFTRPQRNSQWEVWPSPKWLERKYVSAHACMCACVTKWMQRGGTLQNTSGKTDNCLLYLCLCLCRGHWLLSLLALSWARCCHCRCQGTSPLLPFACCASNILLKTCFATNILYSCIYTHLCWRVCMCVGARKIFMHYLLAPQSCRFSVNNIPQNTLGMRPTSIPQRWQRSLSEEVSYLLYYLVFAS